MLPLGFNEDFLGSSEASPPPIELNLVLYLSLSYGLRAPHRRALSWRHCGTPGPRFVLGACFIHFKATALVVPQKNTHAS